MKKKITSEISKIVSQLIEIPLCLLVVEKWSWNFHGPGDASTLTKVIYADARINSTTDTLEKYNIISQSTHQLYCG